MSEMIERSIEAIPAETKRFSPDLKEALEKKGFVVYTIGGQSIKSEKEQGRKFRPTWQDNYPTFWHYKDYEDFWNLTSMYSEVAINSDPKKFYIARSYDKTLNQQLEMIADYSKKLQRKLSSEIEAVMGQAADYVDLTFVHLDVHTMEDRLFGKKYGYIFARTKTPTVGSYVASVGHFRSDSGLHVDDDRDDNCIYGVWAVPLVVPK